MPIQIKPGQLIATQELNCSLEVAWDFLSRPENLSKITPPNMGFVIQSDLPEKMYNGLFIEYLVRLPLLGRSRWISEVKHIDEGRSFVDEQRIGPYAMWHHYHELNEHDGLVYAKDIVHFQLPFGWIGRLFGMRFVCKELERIFTYRAQAFEEQLEGQHCVKH